MPCCRSSLNFRSSSGSEVVSIPPSPVVITLRGWKEKQAIRPCGLPIRSQSPIHSDLAAGSAGRILDQNNAMAIGQRDKRS